jgi:SAM-dependent methyltransferase
MDNCVDLTLTLEWASDTPAGPARHRDGYFAAAVDLAADSLPGGLQDALKGAAPGACIEERLGIEALTGDDAAGGVVSSGAGRFVTSLPNGVTVAPRFGRFYPGALFRGFGQSGGTAMQPFRYLGEAGGKTTFDTRHPLAGRTLQLAARVDGPADAPAKNRRPVDWTALLLDGPGLQACWDGKPTDFVYEGAYARQDEGADDRFYAEPRMVAHLDSRAQAAIGDYYRSVLDADLTALDLMSSFSSNLHADQKPARLLGLGMNAAELRANEMLDGAVVADLNATPVLPFADSCFDAIICTVSVDYLTRPVDVFREARRVLRPGGAFALTFSNRWFPPKVTRLWAELHPFERMGLVASYVAEAGGFIGLETCSLRGLPRPPDDRYAGQTPHADPVFAVAARRA